MGPVLEREAVGGIVSYGGRPLLRTDVARPFAWLVMRDRFDHFLLGRAVEAGAHLLDGLPVTAVEEQDDRVVAHTAQGRFAARWVVGADGVNSRIARAIGLSPCQEVGLALEAEVTVPPSALTAQGDYATFDFGALPHGYGWIFPKREHLSVGVFHARPGQIAGLKGALYAFIHSQPVLQAHRQIRLHGHRIPLGGANGALHTGRVVLAGDAAGLADPWLGEGVYYAIVSARLAAQAIAAALDSGPSALSAYTARIHTMIVRQLRQARHFAAIVYRAPYLGSLLLSKSPLMQRAVFGAIRGDLTFGQLNRALALGLPRILTQALGGGR